MRDGLEVELVGLEPTTSAMPWQALSQLSYSPELIVGREVYRGSLVVGAGVRRREIARLPGDYIDRQPVARA